MPVPNPSDDWPSSLTMGNGHASRIAETPGMETNQGETASPPPAVVRYNIRTEDLQSLQWKPNDPA